MWGEPSWTFSPRQAEQRQEVWYIPNDITWASGFSHAWRQSVQLDAAECSSWNSDTLAIWCKELTHWKRPWCWERLKAGREGDDRGWDGRMASLTQWIWVWASSGSWWWREVWRAAVHGVVKSRTWLSDWTELNAVDWVVPTPNRDQVEPRWIHPNLRITRKNKLLLFFFDTKHSGT